MIPACVCEKICRCMRVLCCRPGLGKKFRNVRLKNTITRKEEARSFLGTCNKKVCLVVCGKDSSETHQ